MVKKEGQEGMLSVRIDWGALPGTRLALQNASSCQRSIAYTKFAGFIVFALLLPEYLVVSAQ